MQRKPYRSKPEGVIIAKVGEEVISFPGMGALRNFLSHRPGLTVSEAKHVYRGVTEDMTSTLPAEQVDISTYLAASKNVMEVVSAFS